MAGTMMKPPPTPMMDARKPIAAPSPSTGMTLTNSFGKAVRRALIAQSPRDELGEREVLRSWESDRDQRTSGADRREHRVHSNAVSESNIHARVELVEVPSSGSNQADCEGASLLGTQGDFVCSLCATPPINPDSVTTIDEDVGDAAVFDEGAES